jgi:hypothetical protein
MSMKQIAVCDFCGKPKEELNKGYEWAKCGELDYCPKCVAGMFGKEVESPVNKPGDYIKNFGNYIRAVKRRNECDLEWAVNHVKEFILNKFIYAVKGADFAEGAKAYVEFSDYAIPGKFDVKPTIGGNPLWRKIDSGNHPKFTVDLSDEKMDSDYIFNQLTILVNNSCIVEFKEGRSLLQ